MQILMPRGNQSNMPSYERGATTNSHFTFRYLYLTPADPDQLEHEWSHSNNRSEHNDALWKVESFWAELKV